MTASVLAGVAMAALMAALRPYPAARRVGAAPVPPARPHWRVTIDRFRRRGPDVDPAELATWCDSIARSLRGGATLHHALRSVAPPACVADSIAPATLALERGASVSAAFDDLAPTSPHLDLVLVVFRACSANGGAAAEPIDRAAAALRQRAALAGERRTQSAQARMSARVMTLLPGAMLGMLLVTSGSVRSATISPAGLVVLALGATLNLAGWSWMRRLIAVTGS